uniref:(northern house mosquito) hypothetical protein n=1 Tax=Culex pipiens TaxID=7175 RepID=A0A8D8FXB9_CULPI
MTKYGSTTVQRFRHCRTALMQKSRISRAVDWVAACASGVYPTTVAAASSTGTTRPARNCASQKQTTRTAASSTGTTRPARNCASQKQTTRTAASSAGTTRPARYCTSQKQTTRTAATK